MIIEELLIESIFFTIGNRHLSRGYVKLDQCPKYCDAFF